MDSWTKIQSGSIYYALNKLEKEGLIVLSEKAGTGSKVRKIYSITEKGKLELKELVKQELKNPIHEIGSDKFIIYPLLNTVDKATMLIELQQHIQKLNSKKAYLEKWKNIKINEQTLGVEKIAFEMMLSSLEYQIKWHNALINDMDSCMKASEEISKLISVFDFSNEEDKTLETAVNIESLKHEILNNPDIAAEKLEQLIKVLKK
jgi:DNA-binding PadR family transcriptional regulator